MPRQPAVSAAGRHQFFVCILTLLLSLGFYFIFHGSGEKWAQFSFPFFSDTWQEMFRLARRPPQFNLEQEDFQIKIKQTGNQAAFWTAAGAFFVFCFLPLTRLGKPRGRRSVTPERKSNFALKREEERRSQTIQWAAVWKETKSWSIRWTEEESALGLLSFMQANGIRPIIN